MGVGGRAQWAALGGGEFPEACWAWVRPFSKSVSEQESVIFNSLLVSRCRVYK